MTALENGAYQLLADASCVTHGDDRIKILFIMPALVPGGAERVVATLLRRLSRQKFDLTFAVVNLQNSVFTDELPKDIPVIDLKTPRLRYSLSKIVGLIRNLKPDLVFSTIDYFNVALAATRVFWPSRTRFIARPTILFSALLERQNRPALRRMLTKMALSKMDLLIFQSPEMEQDYRISLGWNTDKAIVIPNPLDFAFVRERIASQLPHTGFDHRFINLVSSGRLEEQKGFDIAIEAIARLKNPRVRLTILGEGSLREKLEKQAKDLGIEDQLRLAGYCTNPYPFYTHADGFLLSSRFEGFPNVVIEALACGTPVISTPVAGLRSLFSKIPETHLAVDHTPAALSSAIGRFIANGSRRVANECVDQFDVRQVVLRYEEAFTKLHYQRQWFSETHPVRLDSTDVVT